MLNYSKKIKKNLYLNVCINVCIIVCYYNKINKQQIRCLFIFCSFLTKGGVNKKLI